MNPAPEPSTVSIVDRAAWQRAAAVAFAAFAVSTLIHFVVLQGFPNSGDEYAYLWQATAFAEGKITAPSPEPHAAFRFNHLGDANGRRFCKYTPGWPLLLALGVLVGAPGIVNPLLAALALAGIYRLGCTWLSPRAAAAGTALIGTTPFFLLNAASYYSHPACLFALTAMALALTWSAERRGPWGPAVAGAAWGLAVLVRPFSAALVGIPLIVWFAWRWRLRDGVSFVVGGLPMLGVLMFVNSHVTGSWATLPWTQFDPSEKLGFGVYGHTPLRGLKNAIRLLAEGCLTMAFVAPFVALRTWVRRAPHRTLLWITAAAIVAGHFFWWSTGGNRYGPRFYFEALLPFTLIVGAGFDSLRTPRTRRATIVAAACAGLLVSAIVDTAAYRQIAARRDVYRVAEQAHLDGALVFLETASADMVRIDLTRNPPDFQDAPVLYALSRGAADEEVRRAFPRRSAYWYRWTPHGGALRSTPWP